MLVKFWKSSGSEVRIRSPDKILLGGGMLSLNALVFVVFVSHISAVMRDRQRCRRESELSKAAVAAAGSSFHSASGHQSKSERAYANQTASRTKPLRRDSAGRQ